MTKNVLVDIVIVVDSNSDWTVGHDVDETVEAHADNYGTVNTHTVYTFTARAPIPEVKELGTVVLPVQSSEEGLYLAATAN